MSDRIIAMMWALRAVGKGKVIDRPPYDVVDRIRFPGLLRELHDFVNSKEYEQRVIDEARKLQEKLRRENI